MGHYLVLVLDRQGIPDSLSSSLDADALFCVEFGEVMVGALSCDWLLCVIKAPTCKPAG